MEKKLDRIGRQRHPATLTFQALRIFVNDELNELYNGLKVAHQLLKPNGTCAVISFHSLEHRIVQQVFGGDTVRLKQTPVIEDGESGLYTWHTDFTVIKPDEKEIERNPRSRSAQLRTGQKRVSR